MAMGIANPAHAEEFLFAYNAELGAQDAYDADGTPIEGWCAILRQDRENYYIHDKRDDGDEPDPFFNIPARRAMIPGKCDIQEGVFDDPGAQIRDAGRQFYVTVRVFGTAARITRIRIGDGN